MWECCARIEVCIIVVKLCAVWTNYLKMQLLTCRFSWKFSLEADFVTSDRAGCPYLQQVSFQNVFPLRDLGKNGTLGSKFCHPRRDLSNLFQMHLNVTLYLILLLRKDRILIYKRRRLKSLKLHLSCFCKTCCPGGFRKFPSD